MKRSFNEVTNEYRKALIGAGYPVGIAEDVSRAAACLQRLGLDSTSAIAAVLPDEDGRALSAGLLELSSLFECIAAGEAEMTLSGIETPALAIAMGVHVAGQQDCAFQVSANGHQWLITASGFDGEMVDEAPVTGTTTMTVHRCEDATAFKGEHRCATMAEGTEVNEAVWPDILRWSKKTYVPASEQSRLSGAGAGLTDND